MTTQVSVKAKVTGAFTYYSTYAAARSAASSGDVITIWADLNEQIILKDGVDINIISGRILDMTSAMPTIIDNGVKCICNIFGEGIIKNSYSGTTKYECVKLTNSQSQVYMECDYLEASGNTSSLSRSVATILISNASKFNLICNNIYNHRDSAIIITICENLYIKCKTIESGISGETNIGTSVINSKGSGYIFSDDVICNGFGSCIEQTGGNLFANILKLTTKNNATAAKPTVLLDNVSGNQNLNLIFDEIQNLNTIDGDTVTLAEGKATLKGRRIYSEKGLSLDLAANANIICSEIVSLTQGVNITNTNPEKIIIDADLIEGSTGNSGVIYSLAASNFTIRNAKIKNTSTSSYSVGVYLNASNASPYVELKNVIIVTGNIASGETIQVLIGANAVNIYNYGLFLNKDFTDADVLIGTVNNYKLITDVLVT